MIAPRWRKVLGDLRGRPGRSLLAVVALAAGVFQVGAMLYKFALLQPELTTMYDRTTPSSATLTTDAVDDALVAAVRRVPGVARAEARPVLVARVRVGADEWLPAVLYVVRDFDRQQLDTFGPEAGAWPPPADGVLLERSALTLAKARIGAPLTIRSAGGSDRAVTVAGTAHAPGLAPAWMEHMVPGFVAWDSPLRAEAAAGGGESAQIRIRVAGHPDDEGFIREVADSVAALLAARGHPVTRITVPPPGKHPHADQMAAFLYLLLAFGLLSFALSTVLVAGMIQGLMVEQVRQVGILKALGATSRQIAGIYLGQVGLLAAGGLALGIPLGLVVGRAYAEFAAGILNANLGNRPFPWWLLAAEVVLGLAVPLAVALAPVRRAARITVHDALRDEGGRPFGAAPLDRALTALRGVPRPLALSLRTAFRRPGRLALTAGVLAVGGATFMSALNVAAAWTRSVEADFACRRYDLTASLAEATRIADIERVLATVPGVAHAEYWPGASPYLVGADGVAGNTVALVGPDPDSRLLALPLLAGRRVRAGETGAAVVNHAVLVQNPALRVGGDVRVRMAGRTTSFRIVGIVRELAPMPVIYAHPAVVRAATGRPAGLARTVRIVTRGHDDAAQRAAASALERAFAGAGIEVAGMQRMLDVKQGILDHLVIILSILTLASVIVVFVGGVGLASTLTVNVVQRTREIGVLGAIGATPRTIAGQVATEGVIIALLSWVGAVVLSAPLSWALETTCGRIFFKVPLDFYLSPAAAGAWLALALGLAFACSFYPARRAARLPVREALNYT